MTFIEIRGHLDAERTRRQAIWNRLQKAGRMIDRIERETRDVEFGGRRRRRGRRSAKKARRG